MEDASIPVFAPHLGVDTLKAVTDAFDVGWLGMGATTQRFEEAIQAYLMTDRHVVATMTGSAALHLGLMLAGVKAGDEVIVPSFNYIADVQAVLWCGATPVFCDIDEESLGLDPLRVAELITPRTRAIMPLHFAGRVGDLDAIHMLATKHHLRVVEDATHALGSLVHGRRVGAFGDIACFSFDPVKIMTSIDGGAVVCARHEDVTVLHRLRLLGVDKDTTERYKNRRAWDYDVTSIGFRAHMTNINAAIGLSQLARIEEFIANRRQYCRTYDRSLRNDRLDWLLTHEVEWGEVSPFIYTARVLHNQRETFIEHMRRNHVACGIHFLPCHLMTLCRDFPRGSMDVTERIGREIVTLPLWSNMHSEVQARVIEAARTFAGAPGPARTAARGRAVSPQWARGPGL